MIDTMIVNLPFYKTIDPHCEKINRVFLELNGRFEDRISKYKLHFPKERETCDFLIEKLLSPEYKRFVNEHLSKIYLIVELEIINNFLEEDVFRPEDKYDYLIEPIFEYDLYRLGLTDEEYTMILQRLFELNAKWQFTISNEQFDDLLIHRRKVLTTVFDLFDIEQSYVDNKVDEFMTKTGLYDSLLVGFLTEVLSEMDGKND